MSDNIIVDKTSGSYQLSPYRLYCVKSIFNAQNHDVNSDFRSHSCNCTQLGVVDGKFYYYNKDGQSAKYYEPSTSRIFKITPLPDDVSGISFLQGNANFPQKQSMPFL